MLIARAAADIAHELSPLARVRLSRREWRRTISQRSNSNGAVPATRRRVCLGEQTANNTRRNDEAAPTSLGEQNANTTRRNDEAAPTSKYAVVLKIKVENPHARARFVGPKGKHIEIFKNIARKELFKKFGHEQRMFVRVQARRWFSFFSSSVSLFVSARAEWATMSRVRAAGRRRRFTKKRRCACVRPSVLPSRASRRTPT